MGIHAMYDAAARRPSLPTVPRTTWDVVFIDHTTGLPDRYNCSTLAHAEHWAKQLREDGDQGVEIIERKPRPQDCPEAKP